ncbi:MAG TPA: hypothetical protein VN240_13290 [Propylenella sp.]|nr:hypothetical protein [Propylenella sp.]
MGISLDDDIRAIVEQAIDSGGLLHIPEASKRLAAAHPGSGLAASEIADILLRAGVSARVPLEWGSSRDYPTQTS